MLSNSSSYKIIVNIFFLILFPFFFIYSVLLAHNLIIYIPGYFSLFSVLTVIFLMMNFFSFLIGKKYNLHFIEIIFFVLLLYIFLISFINYYFNNFNEYSLELLKGNIQAIIFNLVCYFLAKNLYLENSFFRRIFIIFFFICTLLVFLNINEFGIFYLKLNSENSELLSTYQSFARTLVVMSFISFTLTIRSNLNLVILIIAILSLFLNSARTEFVLFCFAIFLYLFIFDFRKTIIRVLFLTSLMIFILFYNQELLNYIFDSRIWELITNTDSSTSLNARMETIHVAIESIKSNFILGDYGSYVSELGIGMYAHNLLSAWVDLGFLGFLYFIFILVYIMIKLYSLKKFHLNNEYILLFLFFIFYFLAILVSKSYTYMFLGFLIAFCVRLDRLKLKENNE